MNPKLLRRNTHGAKSLEVLESLENDGSLKHEEHSQRHETEVPVLVKEPQAVCEQLEDEKWRNHVFFVNVDEIRNWHVHFVRTQNKSCFSDIEICFKAFSTLVVLDALANGVGHGVEAVASFAVNKLFLLHFNLVSHTDFSGQLDCNFFNRHDESFGQILFVINHEDPNVRAFLDLVHGH